MKINRHAVKRTGGWAAVGEVHDAAERLVFAVTAAAATDACLRIVPFLTGSWPLCPEYTKSLSWAPPPYLSEWLENQVNPEQEPKKVRVS